MKKIICLALLSLCLFSCVQNPRNNTQEKETVKPYKVIELVDTLISQYPNLYVNKVVAERFCKHLYLELDKKLTEDNSFLSEIPMRFMQMLKSDSNKYLLKFECGEYTTDDERLLSEKSKTRINFAIFAKVDEDFASTLENNAIYTLSGTYKGYVDGKLTLPSGRLFDYPSHCYKSKSGMEEYGNVCLGGFLFDKIKVTKQ